MHTLLQPPDVRMQGPFDVTVETLVRCVLGVHGCPFTPLIT